MVSNHINISYQQIMIGIVDISCGLRPVSHRKRSYDYKNSHGIGTIIEI